MYFTEFLYNFLLDLLTTVFNTYTHELLLISLIICVAKYIMYMSINNKYIHKFCYVMKSIYVIVEIEFAIAIKHGTLSKHYKMVTFKSLYTVIFAYHHTW